MLPQALPLDKRPQAYSSARGRGALYLILCPIWQLYFPHNRLFLTTDTDAVPNRGRESDTTVWSGLLPKTVKQRHLSRN